MRSLRLVAATLALLSLAAGCSDGRAQRLEELGQDGVFLTIPAGAEVTSESIRSGCLDTDSGGYEGYAYRALEFPESMEAVQVRDAVVDAFRAAIVETDWLEEPALLPGDEVIVLTRQTSFGAYAISVQTAGRAGYVYAYIEDGAFCGN